MVKVETSAQSLLEKRTHLRQTKACQQRDVCVPCSSMVMSVCSPRLTALRRQGPVGSSTRNKSIHFYDMLLCNNTFRAHIFSEWKREEPVF